MPKGRGGWRTSVAPQVVALLSRVRAVILLGGSLRPGELLQTTRRSIVDLPVERGMSILDLWHDRVDEFASRFTSGPLSLRLVLDRRTPAPRSTRHSERVELSIERDIKDYRGTAGILRDLTRGYDGDDFVLLANAAQIVTPSLARFAEVLAGPQADAAVLASADGTPSGFCLLRCACLEALPAVGFVDLKEQGLAQIAERFDVRVVEERQALCAPVRDLADYIRELRVHRASGGSTRERAAFADDGFSSFAVVEEGAEVDPAAHLHDAVVLRGGRVEGGAAVIRGLVAAGGVVSARRTVLDAIVSVRGRRPLLRPAFGRSPPPVEARPSVFARLRLW